MKKWYSAEELVGLPGMADTIEGVIEQAEKGGWVSRPVTRRKLTNRCKKAKRKFSAKFSKSRA